MIIGMLFVRSELLVYCELRFDVKCAVTLDRVCGYFILLLSVWLPPDNVCDYVVVVLVLVVAVVMFFCQSSLFTLQLNPWEATDTPPPPRKFDMLRLFPWRGGRHFEIGAGVVGVAGVAGAGTGAAGEIVGAGVGAEGTEAITVREDMTGMS